MGSGYRVLSEEQVAHFLDRGYVVINGCFTPEAAEEYTRTIWKRLGYDPANPSTWTESGTHLPVHREMDIKEFAPKAWDAVCDLVGGEDRIKQPYNWGDGFVVNLSPGSEEPWSPPSSRSPAGPYANLVGQCTEFVEATGRIGDVYLLHPYILHAKHKTCSADRASSPTHRSPWPNQ